MTSVSKSMKEFILLLPPALSSDKSTDGSKWRCGPRLGGGGGGGQGCIQIQACQDIKSVCYGITLTHLFLFCHFILIFLHLSLQS